MDYEEMEMIQMVRQYLSEDETAQLTTSPLMEDRLKGVTVDRIVDDRIKIDVKFTSGIERTRIV